MVDYVSFEHILLEDRGSPLSEGGCCYYSIGQMQKLNSIRHLQQLGFTLVIIFKTLTRITLDIV